MYQRAIKITRVLEETERENQARNLEKQKRETPMRSFQSGNNKRFRPSAPPRKGKQPMTRQFKPYYRKCGKTMGGYAFLKVYAALNVERSVTKGRIVQKFLGTKIEHHPLPSSRNPHFPHHNGDPLCLAIDDRPGIVRNRKEEDEFTARKQNKKERKSRML